MNEDKTPVPANLFQAVIFDFDYTLADSSAGIIACTNFAFECLGLPAVPAERICATIGLSLAETFATLAGPPHPGQTEAFIQLYVQRADEIMVDRTVLYDSVPRLATLLKGRGLRLGIVSTKYRRRIEAVLRRERVENVFDVIIGGEDVSAFKPDPEGLQLAMARLNRSPSATLYVGDSVTDAETAQRAAVPFAAVLSGVTTREQFSRYAIYRVMENLSELERLVAASVQGNYLDPAGRGE